MTWLKPKHVHQFHKHDLRYDITGGSSLVSSIRRETAGLHTTHIKCVTASFRVICLISLTLIKNTGLGECDVKQQGGD